MNISGVSLGMAHVGTGGQPVQSVDTSSTGQLNKPSLEAQSREMEPNHHDVEKLQKSVDDLNERLVGGSLKVVLDPHSPANKLWLNVIDSANGQVIEKLPPEGLRRFFETNGTAGLKFDLKY